MRYFVAFSESKTGFFSGLGGENHKTGQAQNRETCFRNVEKSLFKLLPQAKVDHLWSDQAIVSNDGLPFIGTNDADQFIATGFCGNGFTFGIIAAVMARDLGRNAIAARILVFHKNSRRLRRPPRSRHAYG